MHIPGLQSGVTARVGQNARESPNLVSVSKKPKSEFYDFKFSLGGRRELELTWEPRPKQEGSEGCEAWIASAGWNYLNSS